MKLAAQGRVIGDIAEILWSIVVSDVGRVGPIGSRRTLIGGLHIVSLLVPAEGYRCLLQLGDKLYVFLHVR